VLSVQPHFNGIFDTHAATPPQSLISTVTGPISSGGLGESTIDLFLHYFPRYAIPCTRFAVPKIYGPSQFSWP
jgi:hypothetical protein